MSSKNLGPVFYAGEKRNVRRHDVKICLACALALCIDNFLLKNIFSVDAVCLPILHIAPLYAILQLMAKLYILSFILASSKKASDVICRNINDVGHRIMMDKMCVGGLSKLHLSKIWSHFTEHVLTLICEL